MRRNEKKWAISNSHDKVTSDFLFELILVLEYVVEGNRM
jgi:hypothetical protein